MFHLTAHHHSFTKKADIVVKIWSYNEHRVYTKNNRVRLIKQHGGFAHCWYDSCITWDELGLAWVASKLLFKKLLIQNKVDYFKQSEFLAPRVQNSLAIFLSYSLNFHIDHNASCSPPKFCITHCFTFLMVIKDVPNCLCKIWGVNNVHHGQWENGEFSWNEVEYEFESRYIVLLSAWLN